MSIHKQCYVTSIGRIFCGESTAFIYTWISKQWKIVYVGQTNDARGTLGRARQHVGSSGTLRKRFEAEVGLPLESADDLILLSFPLPAQSQYMTEESSYREAVEYLVQIGMYEARLRLSPAPKIISVIRCNPVRVSDVAIRRYADEILQVFSETYSSLADD